MSKWVEVTVAVTKVFAIEVSPEVDWDDEDIKHEAQDVALGQYCGDDVEIVGTLIASDEAQAEQIKRLADERIAL